MADWYYAANGQQAGPVDFTALRQMLDTAQLSGADLVYGPGLSQWTPAAQVPALAAGVSGAAPLATAAPMIGYRGVETGATGLSGLAIDALRKTKPWVRFIGIMTFIGAGLMALGGMGMLLAGVTTANRNVIPTWLGGVYLAMAAIYIIPGVLLNRYANRIASLLRTQSMADVEQALGAQKSFWRFAGIMLIIVMCGYVVLIVGLIVFKLRF